LSGDGAGKPTHIAFVAQDETVIQNFYALALENGAKDNGAPGPRKQYHPGYYGAFIIDIDGNNIEVVMHNHSEEE
jgi:predicted lactoylglutathione lyase